MGVLKAILVFLRAFILDRAAAAFENLALRQQLAVCKQSIKRPKLRLRDRVFWVWLSRLWPKSPGIQTVLEMEIQGWQARTPRHQARNS